MIIVDAVDRLLVLPSLHIPNVAFNVFTFIIRPREPRRARFERAARRAPRWHLKMQMAPTRTLVVVAVSTVAVATLLLLTAGLLSRRRRPSARRTTPIDAPADCVSQFESATLRAKGLEVDTGTQLALYGLYKRATAGPTTRHDAPNILDQVGRAKHAAWLAASEEVAASGERGTEEAMARYASLVARLVDSGRPPRSQGGGLGPRVSTMVQAPPSSAAKSPSPSYSLRTQSTDGGWTPVDLELADEYDEARLAAFEGLEARLDAAPRALVDVADDEGRRLLHWAADGGHVDAVAILIRRGADVAARDADGLSALDYAATQDALDVATLLVRAGAEASTARDLAPPDGLVAELLKGL